MAACGADSATGVATSWAGAAGAVSTSSALGCARAFSSLSTVGDGPGRDTDVCDDAGEPGTGVSPGWEDTDVVSVADDDGTSTISGAASSDVGTSDTLIVKTSSVSDFGDSGGVGRSSALWTMSSGGYAPGEMITPGACEGLSGRRDHITQLGSDTERVDCCAGSGGASNGGV